ncbi:hypothetical protein GGX14DRAFT_424535 [Mycena pura]|uniref:F-box domain-containing protein n=1 Tax=Mycena pura TaxID=153505 RepID=A0AAD6YMY5_9AGAR|nr:hypothetical protein GGX14DRAFT_424535 [Mycena pura]
MHLLLLLDDVLRQIFDFCPKPCLAVVARSSRSWTDPALDGIWSHLTTLEPLLRLIPGLVCVDGVYNVFCEGPLQLDVFYSYARRIRHITQRHDIRVHPDLLSFLSTPVLDKLLTTRLSLPDLHSLPAALSLSPSLRQLDLDFGFKQKGRNGDASHHHIESLLEIATALERVRLRGLGSPLLNICISRMSNLHSLALRMGSVMTANTLVAVSSFPHLSELDIEASHLDVDAFSEAWPTPMPNEMGFFPRLQKLHISARAPLLRFFLKTMRPAYLHTLRFDVTTVPSDSSVDWSSIFDLLRTHTSQTLEDLTIEHHLNDVDLDASPSVGTSMNTPTTTHTPQKTDLLTFDKLRLLAPLRLLRKLTIDITYNLDLCDADIEELSAWWPNLTHLHLDTLHPSDCLPSTATRRPRATLACLRTLASSMPALHTLILPLDSGSLPSPFANDIMSNALSRLIISEFAPPPDSAALALYLHHLFPRLAEVEGTDEQHQAEWIKIQHQLDRLQVAVH